MDENRPQKEDFSKFWVFFALAGGRQRVKYYFKLKAAFIYNKSTMVVDSLGEEIFSHFISAYSSSKESFSTQPCPSFLNYIVTLHFALHYAAER